MLGAAERIEASEQAAAAALPHLKTAALPIALYWPVRGEISPLVLAEHLYVHTIPLCLPVVIAADTPLQFRAWKPGDPLHKGRYGIDEPAKTSPFVTPQTLVVPLLGFDRQGNRLGTGGGYYDRTLQQLRCANQNIKAYGLAFAFQENGTLLREDHDQLLNGVFTNTGFIKIEI